MGVAPISLPGVFDEGGQVLSGKLDRSVSTARERELRHVQPVVGAE